MLPVIFGQIAWNLVLFATVEQPLPLKIECSECTKYTGSRKYSNTCGNLFWILLYVLHEIFSITYDMI